MDSNGYRCGLQTGYGAMRGQRMPSDAHDRQPGNSQQQKPRAGNSQQQKPRTVSSRLGWLRCWCMHCPASYWGCILRFACARCVGCGQSARDTRLFSLYNDSTQTRDSLRGAHPLGGLSYFLSLLLASSVRSRLCRFWQKRTGLHWIRTQAVLGPLIYAPLPEVVDGVYRGRRH